MSSKAALPSVDQWLQEARSAPGAEKVGMYLTHNGVVRKSARAHVYKLDPAAPEVTGMLLSCDRAAAERTIRAVEAMEGIYYVRVWLNEGHLRIGDSIMYVLIGGDTRSHTVTALEALVSSLKTDCLQETELYEPPV